MVKEHLLAGFKTALDSPAQDVNSENLEAYSGVRKCSFGQADIEDRVGHVNGLAWTSVGGDILPLSRL